MVVHSYSVQTPIFFFTLVPSNCYAKKTSCSNRLTTCCFYCEKIVFEVVVAELIKKDDSIKEYFFELIELNNGQPAD